MKAIVLFSGGLDSTTCLAKAVHEYGAKNVTALSLSYGQKHEKEIQCAEKIVRYYGVEHIEMEISEVFKGSDCTLLKGNAEVPDGAYAEQLKKTDTVTTYVPFRNGLFLSIATAMALVRGCDVVIYGAHQDDAAGDAYPDCTEYFATAMGEAIAEGTGWKVELETPFINTNKAGVVKQGLKLGVPYEMTWSCYNGGEKPCGKCGTCIDRAKAFKANGVKDPAL